MSLKAPPTNDPVITALAESLRGTLLRPDDEGYDEARTVWNGMIRSEEHTLNSSHRLRSRMPSSA